MGRTCVFCCADIETRGGRSKEHAIPEWVLKHLGAAADPVAPSLFRPTNATNPSDSLVFVAQRAPHRADGLVAGRVCERCNTGWMSQLETEAKPLVTSLIDGESSPQDLGDNEKLILTKWAVKTAVSLYASVAELKSSTLSRVLDLGPLSFKQCDWLPDELVIVAGSIDGELSQKLSWHLHTTWINTSRAAIAQAFKVMMQIGRLTLCVAHLPAGTRVALWLRIHTAIRSVVEPHWYEYTFETPSAHQTHQVQAFEFAVGVCDRIQPSWVNEDDFVDAMWQAEEAHAGQLLCPCGSNKVISRCHGVGK